MTVKKSANLEEPQNTISFKHIKTTHSFHIVDPSPWPFVAASGALMLTFGAVMCMHKYKDGLQLLQTGFVLIVYVMFTWWRDVIREATFEDKHTVAVQRGIRLGVVLFIVSEVMFFFSFFWAFFHSSMSPSFYVGGMWPPRGANALYTLGLPLTNSFLLLVSGVCVTWAHESITSRDKRQTIVGLNYAIISAILFTSLQLYEYKNSPFSMSDGIYGSCFYITTGFHGFHVVVGTIALIVAMIRVGLNHFTDTHHIGLESAIWYWHFVDVVWLFLFLSIYWWGAR
jgi:cytochrome c oxidase subunit 3